MRQRLLNRTTRSFQGRQTLCMPSLLQRREQPSPMWGQELWNEPRNLPCLPRWIQECPGLSLIVCFQNVISDSRPLLKFMAPRLHLIWSRWAETHHHREATIAPKFQICAQEAHTDSCLGTSRWWSRVSTKRQCNLGRSTTKCQPPNTTVSQAQTRCKLTS